MLGAYRGGSPLGKRPRLNEDGIKMEWNGDTHAGVRSGILPMVGSAGGMGGGSDFGTSSSMPSRVLQVRGLLDNTMEADLVDALSHFGPVSYVSLTGRGTALVEFEDLSAAERCVTHNRTADIVVLNAPAFFNYANVQIIPRQGLESDRPSNVLIFYVQNPKYPITPDVIYAIVKPIARVHRIIVNRQNGIQALVELGDIDNARIAKQRLNGCDIYSGCCTLKIEYAKMQRLNTIPSNIDHADYITGNVSAANENPLGFDELGRPIFGDSSGMPAGGTAGMDVKPLLGGAPAAFGTSSAAAGRTGLGLMDDYQSAAQAQIAALNASSGTGGGGGPTSQQHNQPAFVGGAQPPFGAIGSQSGMMMMGGGGGGGLGDYMSHGGGGYDQGGPHPMRHHEAAHYHPGQRLVESESIGPDGCGVGGDNGVLMIYGIDSEKVNCDKLFNLFCLYGNVMRIKFLKSKNDTVMVQMGDALAAQRAIDCLKNCVVFGKPMHMALSRQPQLKEVRGEPLELPDKTTSYRDYSNARLNRFVTTDIASKNRINPPQKFIYFFNAPPYIQDDRLYQVFEEKRAPKPVDVKLFPQRGTKVPKNSAGLIEFEDETQAVEALMLCNHVLMDSDGSRHPFVLKLCFAGPASTSVNTAGNPFDAPHGADRGYGGGYGGRNRDRDREGGRRDRDYFDRHNDPDGRANHYNGPGGPRRDRDRRDDSRDRDRSREGPGRDFYRGRGRGRGGGGRGGGGGGGGR